MAVGAVGYYLANDQYVSTDNAYVHLDKVSVSAQVGGHYATHTAWGRVSRVRCERDRTQGARRGGRAAARARAVYRSAPAVGVSVMSPQ